MTKIKESSTIQLNRTNVLQKCPISYVMDKIGGHWKPIILYQLLSGAKRYNEVRNAIPAISEKMLIQNLKQLEADGLLIRKSKPVVPPHVTYSLTPSGIALRPVLYAMAEWAIGDSKLNTKKLNGKLEDFGR